MKIAHVVHTGTDNAGDIVLADATRRLFARSLGKVEWVIVPLRDAVTRETIETINACDLLLIGGGGMFLKDSNPNDLSGWQWAIAPDLLRAIKIPIAVWAVGYNRFRGQEDFAPCFRESMAILAEKCCLFAVRNRGSQEALQEYLPPLYRGRVTVQPCPTIFAEWLYPEVEAKPDQSLAFAPAFDRAEMRGVTLANLCDMSAFISPTIVYMHTQKDGCCGFKRWLFNSPAEEIVAHYKATKLTVGMRGHSVMIPIGLGNRAISLVTHDKMRWTMNDLFLAGFAVDFDNRPAIKEAIEDSADAWYWEHCEKYRSNALWTAQEVIEGIGKAVAQSA